MKRIFQKIDLDQIDNWKVFYILIGLTFGSLFASLMFHGLSGEINLFTWADGAFQNFSTEMMGAIATFGLFELVIGARKEREAKEQANEETIRMLIVQMGSQDNTTALNALEQLRVNGWLQDGSLQGADLRQANLQGAHLGGADLQGASLLEANLQGAYLAGAKLQGVVLQEADLRKANIGTYLQDANLRDANLQSANMAFANLENADLSGANLENAELYGANLKYAELTFTDFNEKTVLPDAQLGRFDYHTTYHTFDKYYIEDKTDMNRYTDPSRDDFWQPDWAKKL